MDRLTLAHFAQENVYLVQLVLCAPHARHAQQP